MTQTRKIFLLIIIFMMVTGSQMFAQTPAQRAIWPNICDGILGSISDRDCIADLDKNVEAGLIHPGWEGNSYKLESGSYWVNGQLVWLSADLDKGFCCARRAYLGKPCPRSAGICDLWEKSQKIAVSAGCIDSIPTIWIENDSVFVEVCNNRYGFPLAQLSFSHEWETICEGDSILWQDSWYKEPGSYLDTIKTTRGDSVLLLNLDIIKRVETNLYQSISQGDTISFGEQKIDTAGIYIDTLVSSAGCDSIVILQVLLKEEPINECIKKDSLWRQAGGIFTELFAHSNSKTEFGKQQLLKINSWQFAARIGFEKRLNNNSFFFNKKDCWGESWKVYALAHTTPKTFIPDDCSCNNLSNNSFWTIGGGAEYRVHWYRQIPFVFSAGIGGEFLYNKTEADEDLPEPNDSHVDLFLSPRIDYILSQSTRINISLFTEFPVRFLNNPNRGIGINAGIRVGF